MLFLVRRTLAAIPTLLVASLLIFVSVQVLPGDVAETVLGREATPERVAAIRADLDLDRSIVARYAAWAGSFATGRFGDSTVAKAQGSDTPVWDIIRSPLLNSLVLAGIALLLIIPIALGLGALAAIRAGRAIDQAISIPALALGSMPEFLLGTLAIVVFFTELNLLPPVSGLAPGESPFAHPDRLVLPVFTLVAINAGSAIRLVRATTADVLREDYVMMARLNGYSNRVVLWRFALRNALAPNVQFLALIIRFLIGGVIIVESVFDYPGIGNLLVQAVVQRDVQVIMTVSMLLAVGYVVINILADLATVLLVPKLRTSS